MSRGGNNFSVDYQCQIVRCTLNTSIDACYENKHSFNTNELHNYLAGIHVTSSCLRG